MWRRMQSSALPSELRTPPLPLVALVGHPEVHRELGVWASQVLRPPLVAIAVAEANESVLARLFGGWGWLRAPEGGEASPLEPAPHRRLAACGRTTRRPRPAAQARKRRPSPLPRRMASSRPTGS